MAKTYKAAIYQGPGKVEVVEKDYPVCGDNDVIVKNLMGTICGADHIAYKHDGKPQMIWEGFEFGHEMVSEVVEKGKNVTGIEIGDWVFPNLGYAYRDRSRMATVGGFSEYLLLPDFTMEGTFVTPAVEDQPSVIKLDKSLGLENLCMLEPFSIGTRAAKSMVGRGTTAVIASAGIIGLSTAIMLKHYGFEKIMMLDFSEFRLENARKYGMLTCNPSKEDVKEVLFETFGKTFAYGGEKCKAECWYDCIGNQPCVDYFTKYAPGGATLSLVGVHHAPVQFDAVSICYNQQWIKGCGSMSLDKCFKEIFDCIATGVNIGELITHKFPIDQIEDALKQHGEVNVAHKVAIAY